MFCPACGAEYRSGVTECVDCHVALATVQPSKRRESLRQDYAPLWKRALGQFIDGIIFTTPAFMVGFLLGADYIQEGAQVTIFLSAAAVFVCAACVYLLLADALPGGRSLGKRMLGISVVSEASGRPCTITQSLVRNLLVVFLGPIDWLFIFGRKHQRLGDKVAGTIVIEPLPDTALPPTGA